MPTRQTRETGFYRVQEDIQNRENRSRNWRGICWNRAQNQRNYVHQFTQNKSDDIRKIDKLNMSYIYAVQQVTKSVSMSEFYSALMLARHVSDLIGPFIRSIFYKLYPQIWYVVIRVLLNTSSPYKVVGSSSCRFVMAGRVE